MAEHNDKNEAEVVLYEVRDAVESSP